MLRIPHLLRALGSNTFNSKIMSGQKSISAFFRPLSQKRANSNEQETDAKKLKTDEPDERQPSPNKVPVEPKNPAQENKIPVSTPVKEDSSPKVSALSPEQKAKVEEKRFEAKMKLAAKSTQGLVVNMGASWFKALEPEFSKPYFIKLGEFVCNERSKRTIFPPAEQVFSWSQMCTIKDVKVVILGQDPYHGPGQAHGLCFSVQKNVRPPPSLENMFKELSTDIEGFDHPGHGFLTGWAEQGVLLLNAVLTVQAHNANSHKDKGWEKFTDAVISWINKNKSGVVFMLWGSYAQKKGACIDKKKHHILKGVHPSPLSAHRGFFGCKHFSQCNELLKKQGKTPIDWTRLPKDC